MLKDWHIQDISTALVKRGWAAPAEKSPESYFEGKALVFTNGPKELIVSFIADLGEGYKGPKSIEEAWGSISGIENRFDLWLSRRRDSKWKTEVKHWAMKFDSDSE